MIDACQDPWTDDVRDMMRRVRDMQFMALDLEGSHDRQDLCRRVLEQAYGFLEMDHLELWTVDPDASLARGVLGIDGEGALMVIDGQVMDLSLDPMARGGAWTSRTWTEVARGPGSAPWYPGTRWGIRGFFWDGPRTAGWLMAHRDPSERPLEPWQEEMIGLYAAMVSGIMAHVGKRVAMEEAIARRTRELEEANRALQEHNEMQGRLFTIIAHDLRGPVGTARTLVEMMRDNPEDLDADLHTELIPELWKSLDGTYSLLENLLAWVRGQMKEIQVLMLRFSVVDALEEVRRWLGSLAERMGISLRIEVAEGPGEYTPTVETDRGLGMDAALRDSLFRGITKQRSLGTAGEHGSGLGLHFSHDLARRIGASQGVESTLGRGSTFWIDLPDLVEGDLPALG